MKQVPLKLDTTSLDTITQNTLTLNEALEKISGLDNEVMKIAKARLDSLTKPLGSLGELENIIQKLSGISKNPFPSINKKATIVMCSDNGVVEEGVSSCPKEVTSSVTKNFLKGFTGINVFSNFANSDLFVVDVGVDDDLSDYNGIINRKLRRSTWNIAKGPAMTREEAVLTIEAGINIVANLAEKGYNLLATGEMGIGNTSTSSAIACVLTNNTPQVLVGKGAGMSKEGLEHKIQVVSRSIQLNNPDKNDPIDVLSKVGGFDIAGLVGCFIGSATCRIPILIDGFISSVAALLAIRIEPKVKDFIFPSHISAEPGASLVLEALGMKPILNMDMRVGEGTGAVLAFIMFDAAIEAYTKMGTFSDAHIEQYVPLD